MALLPKRERERSQKVRGGACEGERPVRKAPRSLTGQEGQQPLLFSMMMKSSKMVMCLYTQPSLKLNVSYLPISFPSPPGLKMYGVFGKKNFPMSGGSETSVGR